MACLSANIEGNGVDIYIVGWGRLRSYTVCVTKRLDTEQATRYPEHKQDPHDKDTTLILPDKEPMIRLVM